MNRLKCRLNQLKYMTALLLFSIAFTAINAEATQFKITKVIELAKSGRSPIANTLRWSPDGSKIGYFVNGSFKTVDTLGNVDSIAFFSDVMIRQWEWLSPDEVVINTSQDSDDDSRTYRLNLVTISKKAVEITHACKFEKTHGALESTTPDFKGPFRDLAGNLYIEFDQQNAMNARRREVLKSIEYTFKSTDNYTIPSIQEDAVYAVRMDKTDSIKISQQRYAPYGGLMQDFHVRPDLKYLITGGTIVDLPTNNIFFLDTLIKSFPLGTTGCGFMAFGFNPRFDEALFTRGCDNGIDSVVKSLAVVDLTTNKCIILDSIPGSYSAVDPQYSPEGLKISYHSRGRIYLIFREAIQ